MKLFFRLLVLVAAVEIGLRFFPVRHSEVDITSVHRYLPGWNNWILYHRKIPPFEGVSRTGPLHGVSTVEASLSVNRFGFLFDERDVRRKVEKEIRIGVVGGSTVECSALQADRRWPSVLQSILATSVEDRPLRVFNLGLSAQDTRTHLATVSQLAVKMDLDFLVFMVGANDLFRSAEPFEPLNAPHAFVDFSVFQPGIRGYIKHILLQSQILARVYTLRSPPNATTSDRAYFQDQVTALAKLPELKSQLDMAARPLQDYETNLVSLHALSVAHGIKPIFVTQPMLWKPEMSAEEIAVDWMRGAVVNGTHFQLSSAQSERFLTQLNARLMTVCARENWQCIDLAKEMPRSLDFFYDSLHFNEAGAKFVANRVSVDLLREIREGTPPAAR